LIEIKTGPDRREHAGPNIERVEVRRDDAVCEMDDPVLFPSLARPVATLHP
jgi:hypothetical protein